MDVAVTTVSSKGQVVIPSGMRKDLKEGDRLLIIKNGPHLILKKTSSMELAEDLEFADRTEAALKQYEKGKFQKMDFDAFIQDMKAW